MSTGNTLDPNGRGWSDRSLLAGGVVVVVMVGLVTAALLAKSRGYLDSRVSVTAAMMNVGDGLPERADVKFRGVLVGAVTSVDPGEGGRPNIVHIDLKPSAAQQIPSTVTARVVPSNVFAVSSIQLIDRGAGEPLPPGAEIVEDAELPTALFQSTVNRVRELLKATDGGGDGPPVGVLALIAESTNGRGNELLASGARLQRILTEMNHLMAADPDEPSAMTALADMSRALDDATPGLLDSLDNALVPMRTVAEKHSEIGGLLSAGLDTAGRASSALDNQMDRLIGITTHLEPVVGVFAQHHDKMLPIATRLTRLAEKGYQESWDKDKQTFKANIIVSFTPLWTYIRADCPRYGALEGPSCQTAPEVRKKFDIPQVLLPGSYQPPPELAPPPGAPLPSAELDAGLPMVPGDDEPPLPPGEAAAPASYGGNVGPVNSPGEHQQLSAVLGESASPAQQLLLGPLARGTVVTVTDSPADVGGP
jgi:ABC-type transporter Mla subunit MlaD